MKRTYDKLKRFFQDFYLVLVLIFLYAPIVVMMVLSFNSSKSRSQWGGFTTQWYKEMFESPVIMEALYNTLMIAFLSALIATILGTAAAIVLGMVYNYLPFMILPIYNVLAKIDNNVINAARDLGADSFQVFSKIMLPLSVPGIISGITMVFVPALTTFVISNLLGGGKILLIGNVIEQEFTKGSNWNLGAGLSIVLMIFILISMTLIAKYDSDGEGTAF